MNKILITINGVDVHYGEFIGRGQDIIETVTPYVELFDNQKPSAKLHIILSKDAENEPDTND